MKKYGLLLLLLITVASATYAQKKDTVVLSLYNNNELYMLYPMPFGKDKPDNDFVAEMVLAMDTINVFKADTKKDSTGNYPKRWLTERQCGKKPTNVKDKVALLYLMPGCDVSTQVWNAQEAGALAVVMIHTTDKKDSVSLPKKSNTIKYDNDNKVKIPCFTVRKGIGVKLTQMLPSLVGIKRPKENVPVIQNLVAIVDTAALAAQRAKNEAIAKEAADKHFANQALTEKGWRLTPNPSSEECILQYNLERQATVNIEIFNEIGQVVTNYQLPNTQTGQLLIDVSGWQTGAYNVSLISGSLREVKRLVVGH
jgi:hypothetical protein